MKPEERFWSDMVEELWASLTVTDVPHDDAEDQLWDELFESSQFNAYLRIKLESI